MPKFTNCLRSQNKAASLKSLELEREKNFTRDPSSEWLNSYLTNRTVKNVAVYNDSCTMQLRRAYKLKD